MNIYGHLKAAEDMGIKKGVVMQAQKRWLVDEIKRVDSEMPFYLDWVDGVFDINEVYSLFQLERLCKEKSDMMKQLATVKSILKPVTSDITDQMIETAKESPVENLVDFNRGKATAFCHEDRNPSMYHATRTNQAACPVCDKYFNPIDILMTRDGLSFVEAVKRLN